MPDVCELEAKLVALRREVAEATRSGLTTLQVRKLRADCWRLWAAIERHKYQHAPDPADITQ